MSNPKLKDYSPDLGATKALFAEAMGTCLLVLAAAGAGAATGAIGGLMGGGGNGAWGAGLTLVVLVLVFGPVSGAHFNPAVSLGLALNGRFAKSKVVPYVGAQVLGAFVAALFLRVVLSSTVIGQTTTAMPGLAALLLEAVLTFWLVWVILAVTERDVPLLQTALAIGLTIAAAGHWAGHLSGASLNPARSLGPALASFDFSQIWIYLIGPTAGGAGAGLAYNWYKGLR